MRILLKRWRRKFGEDVDGAWFVSLTEILDESTINITGKTKPAGQYLIGPELILPEDYQIREDCIQLFNNFIEAETKVKKLSLFQDSNLRNILKHKVSHQKVLIQSEKLMKKLSLSVRVKNIDELDKIRRFGRFRYLVAKHFLTKSLEQIEEDKRSTGCFNLRLIARIQLFNKVTEQLFPRNDPNCCSVGLKLK